MVRGAGGIQRRSRQTCLRLKTSRHHKNTKARMTDVSLFPHPRHQELEWQQRMPLSHDILFQIGGEIQVAQAVEWSRFFAFAFKSLRQRRSLSLTPFPDCDFHCLDSVVADLLHIRRQDVFGHRFFELFRPERQFADDLPALRRLFSHFGHLHHLELVWLTPGILSVIQDSCPALKSLAFHGLSTESPDLSLFPHLASRLKTVAVGSTISTSYVQHVTTNLPAIETLAFMSCDAARPVSLDSLAAVGPSIRRVFFGARPVDVGERFAVNRQAIASSNLGHLTHLELLNPLGPFLSLLLRDVLPKLERLQFLAVSLHRTEDALTCPDSKQPIVLSNCLPDLRSLTLVVDGHLPFAATFGQRPLLQQLRVSGILDPKDENRHLVYFSVEEVRDMVDSAPNLRYLCIHPFLKYSEDSSHLMRGYLREVSRLDHLTTLHLPASVINEQVVRELATRRQMRRIEFVGKCTTDPSDRRPGQQARRLPGLKCDVQHYWEFYFCLCAYGCTNRRERHIVD